MTLMVNGYVYHPKHFWYNYIYIYNIINVFLLKKECSIY